MPLDYDAMAERVSKKKDSAGMEDGAEMVEGESDDHYGALFDALKNNDREAGIAALKACLSG
jgi:hypothetical protein